MKDNNKSDKIDYSKLSQFQLIEKIEEQDKEIQKLKEEKKYGLIWDEERTKEVFEQKVQDKLPVLKEVVKNEIRDVDKLKPNNILIEGDNYHALSVLNYTHKRKVNMIYIDPPYNTGNEFIYNDIKVEKDDLYKHSKWLSFMNKRLQLAKKLLANNGVIFISIDDNEISQLRMLCDEIFNNEFIAQIIIVTNKGGRDYLEIANTHEYMLCYGMKKDIHLNKLPKDISSLKYNDENGIYDIRELRNRNPKFDKSNRPNLHYPIFINPKIKNKSEHCAIGLEQTEKYSIKVIPQNSEGKKGVWRWSKKKLLDNLILDFPEKSEVVAKQRRDGGWNIYEKDRNQTGKAKSIWDEKEMRTELGTITLRQIFKKSTFDHPKPIELIKKAINLSTKKNAIILDFFAGSGTTGHAVLQLNKEDGGNRKFILCTNNENNICTDVCYPRLNKVIKGYNNLKGEKIDGLGGNLKYFKTSFVDSAPTLQNKKMMVDQSTEMLCLKEDCFDPITHGELFKIFRNHNDRYLGIVYDCKGIKPFKKAVLKLNKRINVYIFSLDHTAKKDKFSDVLPLVTLKPIPSAILNTYKKIFAGIETTKSSMKKYSNRSKQIGDKSGVSEV